MTVEVWAPRAERVDVVLGARRLAMSPAVRGWFQCDIELTDGEEYSFSLDGEEPLADPRSPWQPAGVDGGSRFVDHRLFGWSDAAWRGLNLSSAVLYEVHIGTFSDEGNFDGAISHLDEVADLGVDAIEIMPVAQFPGRWGWGYDGVDLYAPHAGYGGPDGLKRLVDACHERGMGAVLDVVYNHLGPSGNHLGRYGPYFTDRYLTPWGSAVNCDGAGSDEVREFIIGNAEMWFRDYHFDGLRLDAVHAIIDTSAQDLLEELAERVDALSRHLGRPLELIAESDRNDPRLVRSRDAGGYGLSATWSDDVHHALHALLTGEADGYYEDFGRVADVAAAITGAYVYDGRFSVHRQRRHGRPATGLPGRRFVVSLQNHDQIGNRAQGDRIGHQVGVETVMVGAALLLLSPFVPLLFQGEEWGATSPFQYFTDHEDPELARSVREGRRNEFAVFGWNPNDIPDPQDENTFRRSVLDRSEQWEPAHRQLRDWYRQLIALRRELPDLADDRLERVTATVDEENRTLVVRRGSVLIAANVGDEPRTVGIDGPAEAYLVSSPEIQLGEATIELPGWSIAVIGASSHEPGVPHRS